MTICDPGLYPGSGKKKKKTAVKAIIGAIGKNLDLDRCIK